LNFSFFFFGIFWNFDFLVLGVEIPGYFYFTHFVIFLVRFLFDLGFYFAEEISRKNLN